MATKSGTGGTFLSKLKDASDAVEQRLKLLAGVPAASLMADVAEMAAAQAAAIKPGVERWAIKTGADPDVKLVGIDGIVDTTVEEMISIPRPKDFLPVTSRVPKYETRRATPVETTVWRLDATIVGIKMEADGDYHLVLQGDSGDFMIAEIPNPDPKFVKPSSPFAKDIKIARKAADDKLKPRAQAADLVASATGMLVPRTAVSAAMPAASGPVDLSGMTFKMRIEPVKARLTGVGFFDVVHGQTGVSLLNGIELHPLLKLEWL